MIARRDHLDQLHRLLRQFAVVGLIGPRQVGKTTLARILAQAHPGPVTMFDLEDPRSLSRLSEPMLALEPLRGLIILDEIQRRPEIFPVLRVLADRPRKPARFLVLGSASPELLAQSSETLAGRITYHELGGLSAKEVGAKAIDRLWLRGGFPPSYSARSDAESSRWRAQFIRTFLERDLSTLGLRLAGSTMHRFWTMLAHYHGQVWNGAELARAFGVSEKTVKHYLDVLASTFMVRLLAPWHANISKRQVKSPKVYLRDTGILHELLDLQSRDQVLMHPKVGASWEGFMIEQIISALKVAPDRCFFWGTHTGAEVDLVLSVGGKLRAFEVKRTDAPHVTASMHKAMTDLELDRLDVIHAGNETYDLAANVRAVCARDVSTLIV